MDKEKFDKAVKIQGNIIMLENLVKQMDSLLENIKGCKNHLLVCETFCMQMPEEYLNRLRFFMDGLVHERRTHICNNLEKEEQAFAKI